MITAPCANCGRRMGRLEKPQHYGEHLVCPQCFKTLCDTDTVPAVPDSHTVPVRERTPVEQRWAALFTIALFIIALLGLWMMEMSRAPGHSNWEQPGRMFAAGGFIGTLCGLVGFSALRLFR